MKDSEYVMFCKCGCKNGVTFKVESEGKNWERELSIQLVSDNYYLMQNKGKMRIKEKLKRIWYIITNREYCYFDIVIDMGEFEDFKNFVNRL